MSQRRILIVDDHPIVRFGLDLLLRDDPDFAICGEAGRADEVLPRYEALRPDIVILDLLLGGRDGIELIRDLLNRDPQARIIVYSCQDERQAGERARRAGASGYVAKGGGLPTIRDALDAVAKGSLYFAGTRIADHHMSARARQQRAIDSLSHREAQVLRLTGRGAPLQQIAQELGLSAKTIGTYRERLKIKLGVDRVQDLLWLAQDFSEGGGRA